MDPATIALIIGALARYGPDAVDAIVNVFRKPEPTQEDWAKLFAVARKSYDDYTKPLT